VVVYVWGKCCNIRLTGSHYRVFKKIGNLSRCMTARLLVSWLSSVNGWHKLRFFPLLLVLEVLPSEKSSKNILNRVLPHLEPVALYSVFSVNIYPLIYSIQKTQSHYSQCSPLSNVILHKRFFWGVGVDCNSILRWITVPPTDEMSCI
jgi:hypothetical protein